MKKIIALVTFFVSFNLLAQEQLYKVTLLRAKPGALLELIDLIKKDINNHEEVTQDKPYLLRHSQGDHWDLMVIYPIESLDKYFSEKSMEKRSMSLTLEKVYADTFFDLVSFQEEAIVSGPTKSDFNGSLEKFNLFHIEIFTALAGKQDALIDQRKAENVYYAGIDHRPNFIFTRVFGPSWDSFTLGGYEDLHEFAGPKISFEAEDKAAKDAGFEGVNYIGSYLRSLIAEHHDTLAYKVNPE